MGPMPPTDSAVHLNVLPYGIVGTGFGRIPTLSGAGPVIEKESAPYPS
jgi:hypothetical protein